MVNSYETGEIKENKKHGQTLFERMIRQTNSVLPILEVCMLENTEYDPNMSLNNSTYDPMFIACTVHPFYPYDLAGLLYDGVIENFSIGAIHGLMYQLAYKLMCIHKMNIVHRDIKPANILLREIFVEDESKPCYFLDAVFCDFGQATILPSDISIMKLSGFEYMQTTDYVLSDELKNINTDDKDENIDNSTKEDDVSLAEESEQIEKLFREALTSATMTLGMHRVTPVCSTLVYRSPEQFVNYPTWLLNGAKWEKNDAYIAAKCFSTSPSWKDQCCIKGNGRFVINQIPTPSLQNQDVFSLGCVFYELFSFNTNTSLERMNKSRYCRKIPHEYIIKPDDLAGPDLITSYINMGGSIVKSPEESSTDIEEPKRTSIEYTSPIQELHALKQLLFSSLAEHIKAQNDSNDNYYQKDNYGRAGFSTDKRQPVQLFIHPMLSNRSVRIGNKSAFNLGDHGKYDTDPSITPEMKHERNALRAFASTIHNRSQESVTVCTIINFIFTVLCLKYGIDDNLKKAFMKHLEKPHSSLSTSDGSENEEKKPFWHFPITDSQTLMLAYIIDICNILRGYSLASSSETINEFYATNTQMFTFSIADIAPPVDYSLISDVVKSKVLTNIPDPNASSSNYIPKCSSLLRQMLTSNAAERLTIKQVEIRLKELFSSHDSFINPNQLMTEEMTKYFLQSYDGIQLNSSAKTSIGKSFPFLTSHESSARSRCKNKLEAKMREQARENKQATAKSEVRSSYVDDTKNLNNGRPQDTYNRTNEGELLRPPAKRDNWSNYNSNFPNYYQPTPQRQPQQYSQQYNNNGYYNNYRQTYDTSGYGVYNKTNNYNPMSSNNSNNSDSFRNISGVDGFIPPQGNYSYQRGGYQGRHGRGGYFACRGYPN